LKCDYIATGHYARTRLTFEQHEAAALRHNASDADSIAVTAIEKDMMPPQLIQSPCIVKDQTYFLSHIPQSSIQHILFPCGSFVCKSHVRRYASQYSLQTANARESMGICFVSQYSSFHKFLNSYLKLHSGRLIAHKSVPLSIMPLKFINQHKKQLKNKNKIINMHSLNCSTLKLNQLM
jgi:tRNA U34 2-thiouridine synthase MnmA/TrmU